MRLIMPSLFLKRRKVQALYVLEGPFAFSNKPAVMRAIAANRLPAILGAKHELGDAGLISYGPNFVELMRRAGSYVDKILKGAKPADLPIEQPTVFEFVVNLRVARMLGIQVPQSILLQATEVIQ
jgi:putative ABC transport system substrate-binding protein